MVRRFKLPINLYNYVRVRGNTYPSQRTKGPLVFIYQETFFGHKHEGYENGMPLFLLGDVKNVMVTFSC